MCGCQETVKELDSGIMVVHGWFTERDDSILSELLQVKLQNK